MQTQFRAAQDQRTKVIQSLEQPVVEQKEVILLAELRMSETVRLREQLVKELEDKCRAAMVVKQTSPSPSSLAQEATAFTATLPWEAAQSFQMWCQAVKMPPSSVLVLDDESDLEDGTAMTDRDRPSREEGAGAILTRRLRNPWLLAGW